MFFWLTGLSKITHKNTEFLIFYHVRATVREGVLPGGGGVPRGGPVINNNFYKNN